VSTTPTAVTCKVWTVQDRKTRHSDYRAQKCPVKQFYAGVQGTNWIGVIGVAGDGTTQTLTDRRPPAQQRFYRVFR
jgi:hypothetical protein